MIIKDDKFVYGVVCDGCGDSTDSFTKFMYYLPKGWARLSLYYELRTGFGHYNLEKNMPDREYCPICTKKMSEANSIPSSFVSDVQILENNIEYKFNHETIAIKFVDEEMKGGLNGSR